ncbi:MAG: hypothetical protein CSA72_02735 [Rhodobacterales bacterium]|nr:MAG: hypothetical protein CSA72_02735 [Rhodobacterales bacterium]
MKPLLTTLSIGVLPFLAAPTAAEDRALIIGVDKYPHLAESLQLIGSANDAKTMERVARDVFNISSVRTLVDGEATAQGIVATIESFLIEGTSVGDRVLISYSGHGAQILDEDGDEADQRDEVLVPFDATLTKTGISNIVTDDQMHNLLSRLNGRSVMLVLDSCNSGTMTRDLNPASIPGRYVPNPADTYPGAQVAIAHRLETTPFESFSNVMAWTAVTAQEVAHVDETTPENAAQGVFTRRFAEGLEGAADVNGNGKISVAELFGHLRASSAEYCRHAPCASGSMTPTLEAPTGSMGLDLLSWAGFSETPSGPNDVSPSDLLPQQQPSNVFLDLLPRKNMRVGDVWRARVTAPDGGYLILLDVRNNGGVVQLFPSVCEHNSRKIQPGASLTIPAAGYGCEFFAEEVGTGKLVAIVTRDNLPLDDLLSRTRDLSVMPNEETYLSELAHHLMSVWHEADTNRAVHWSLASVDYVISR